MGFYLRILKSEKMKSKLKRILIPFILMIIIKFGYYIVLSPNSINGNGLNPHMGLAFASGLLLGPYGALGVGLGDILSNILRGYSLNISLLSGLVNFIVSLLCYKLWYSQFYKEEIHPPILVNLSSIVKFLAILIFTGLVFSLLEPETILIFEPKSVAFIDFKFLLNYINFGLIFGVIGIWITRRLNYYCLPKISNSSKELFYKIILILLVFLIILFVSDEFIFSHGILDVITEFLILTILSCIFLTKPISHKISIPKKATTERIMNIFLFIALILLFLIFLLMNEYVDVMPDTNLSYDESVWAYLFVSDMVLIIFLIPAGFVLKVIDNTLIKPMLSFSEIEDYIHEGEKIETEGLLDLYSKYTDEDNEIGKLARSYSDLITYNNNYIENINEIESERERIKAELGIAERIQKSNLPTEVIKNRFYNVFGYSKPAKEVGGDFYDYFEIDDENLAIVIGDASGKGVPAALLTTTTQTLIRESLAHLKDPSKILCRINNHICRYNSENMFITLWLGIYNKNTNILTFSNAGHNRPIIKKDDKFELLDVNAGIVLGILEDYEFTTSEIDLKDSIILYTDGITDAKNNNNEMYGEQKLIDFFNKNTLNDNIINELIEDINKFTQDREQFDDMTLLILKK